ISLDCAESPLRSGKFDPHRPRREDSTTVPEAVTNVLSFVNRPCWSSLSTRRSPAYTSACNLAGVRPREACLAGGADARIGGVAVPTGAAAAVVGNAVGSAALARVESRTVWPRDWRLSTVSAIAGAAPAAATSNVSSEIQTQSPGYQPKRRSHRRRSAGILPS